MVVLLAIYYITPWIRWDRGLGRPDQAVLIDFEGRRFFFFFIELWPQEVYYIVGLLVLAAFGIFLSSALFGRVWCGYACPQTVWTDLYIYVERWIEGDRNERMRLAKAPLSLSASARKPPSTHSGFSSQRRPAALGSSISGMRRPCSAKSSRACVGRCLSLYRHAHVHDGHARRHNARAGMHLHVPLAAHPAAMTDQHALSVTYRADRGEPRGPHKKNESWEGRGDCIDCRQCVPFARKASTSATAISSNASIAHSASMRATRSWRRSAGPKA